MEPYGPNPAEYPEFHGAAEQQDSRDAAEGGAVAPPRSADDLGGGGREDDADQLSLGVATPFSARVLLELLRTNKISGGSYGRLRRHERCPCRVKIAVRVERAGQSGGVAGASGAGQSGERELQGVTRDISVGGLAFTCGAAIPLGSIVSIRFDLSGMNQPLQGQVKRCAAMLDGQYVVAVQFGEAAGAGGAS